jgi:hypothetical protein
VLVLSDFDVLSPPWAERFGQAEVDADGLISEMLGQQSDGAEAAEEHGE